ncbi:NAD(P)H-dependent oxidoreductase [Collinsella sp. zg1085]|uniref:flavodoxin family protein n=1 Tax=Collinsella sp. zg1085 TaxID=2844380 RepID=UPI001C0CC944|nr:NAD(P)H-dependent oxidoreductase [Collinsella sp. zg1085]QWT17525.1 NAD(P)H-dependent oxidoreductase [Collinsella sp. zg1085]
MSILFVNGSPNKRGNTARLANTLLEGRDFNTLNLVDYRIFSYGQRFDNDQLDEVLSAMKDADTIVMGSPVYWHNLSGAVRNLLDRLYEALPYGRDGQLSGKKLVLLFQGAAPKPWMIEAGAYSISKFCEVYGLEYLGVASTKSEAKNLSRLL